VLSADQIIEIHNDIIREFGGEAGIRDPATLDYTVYLVNRSRNIHRKAAIALHGICTGHPFVDGNKRSAFVTADNLLRDDHYMITASNDDVLTFMLEVASYIHTRETVEFWIKNNSIEEAD
jgi:death on curing protein